MQLGGSVWSALNVPLIWGAAKPRRVLPSVRLVDFSNISSERSSAFLRRRNDSKRAVRIGWDALREALRSWGVNSEAELWDWLGRNGFPATQPGHHIVARAQEHILTAGCRVDARVGLLESVFVTLTLSEGHQAGRQGGTRTNEGIAAIPAEVPRDSWEQMEIILEKCS